MFQGFACKSALRLGMVACTAGISRRPVLRERFRRSGNVRRSVARTRRRALRQRRVVQSRSILEALVRRLSARQILECYAIGADSECAYRYRDDEHGKRNNGKYAERPVRAQHCGDDEADENRTEATPGVDESHGLRANARRIELGLIRMEGTREPCVRERD